MDSAFAGFFSDKPLFILLNYNEAKSSVITRIWNVNYFSVTEYLEYRAVIIPAATKTESALNVASFVGSIIPWIGGLVSNVLGGMSLGRKLGRVREVLEGVTNDLGEFKSEVSENYVKTEEFEDFLEQTLKRAGEERNEEKRHIYRAFLTDAIEHPAESYDEQLRLLRIFEELAPDHIRMLKAMIQEPNPEPGSIGAPIQTLRRRLPEFDEKRIDEVVIQLNDLRVTNLGSLRVTMTGRGAEDLRNVITELGQRILKYIMEA